MVVDSYMIPKEEEKGELVLRYSKEFLLIFSLQSVAFTVVALSSSSESRS